MNFHEVIMTGKYWMQIVSNADIASWSADDEGRLVYNRDDGAIYYADDTSWVSLQETAITVHREDFISTFGQTVFNLSYGYDLGTNRVTVYSNNVLMIKDVDYLETATNQITFLVGRALDEPVTVITTDSATSVFRTDVDATPGQTIFNLPWSYIPGSGNLLVFANNFLMTEVSDYVETDSNTITFNVGRADGEPISFIYYDNIINDLIKFGENLGSAANGEVVFSEKSGNTLRFKRIKPGTGINATAETNDILLTVVPGDIAHNSLASIQGTGNYHVSQNISEGLANSPNPITAANPVASQADLVPVGVYQPAVVAKGTFDIENIGVDNDPITITDAENIASATESISFGSSVISVTFTTPLDNADYQIIWEELRFEALGANGASRHPQVRNKTVNGFDFLIAPNDALYAEQCKIKLAVIDLAKLGIVNQTFGFDPAVVAKVYVEVGDIGAVAGTPPLSNIINVSSVIASSTVNRTDLAVTFTTPLGITDYVLLHNVYTRAGGALQDGAEVSIIPDTKLSGSCTIQLAERAATFQDIDIELVFIDPAKLGVIDTMGHDNLIAVPQARTVGTIYQASTAGLVTARIEDTNRVRMRGLIGPTNPPSIEVAYASDTYAYSGPNTLNQGISFPVPKGYYYQVEDLEAGTPQYMYWFPLA